jgi:hypothetical protein
MPSPILTFFCELESNHLAEFFDDPDVIRDLTALNASVSLSVQDLSEERAKAVKKLNAAGVPVTAWLLLPKEEGYYFNIENASLSLQRYQEFKRWTDERGLRWSAIGLDIEPDLRLLLRVAEGRWRALWREFPQLIAKAMNRRRFWNARRTFTELVDQIHADGYLVESYQFPVLEDERRVRSTLLQRLSGVVDISADREVWMLYSSFSKKKSPGYLWSYASQAKAIGVGSTGGDVEADAFKWSPLNWDELARDLRLAWHWTDHLYIFSLEGSYLNGYLKRLQSMVWDQPIFFPTDAAESVTVQRRALQSFLLFNKYSPVILAVLFAGFAVVVMIQRIIRQRQAKILN